EPSDLLSLHYALPIFCFTEMGINIAKIAEGIERGEIKTLIVFGENVLKRAVNREQLSDKDAVSDMIEEHGLTAELLGKLETLIRSEEHTSELQSPDHL